MELDVPFERTRLSAREQMKYNYGSYTDRRRISSVEMRDGACDDAALQFSAM